VLPSSSRCEWLCGRRRQTVPSDDDVLNVVAMGCLGLDSCSCTRKTILYNFLVMLAEGGLQDCVDVDAQLLLVSSTSAKCTEKSVEVVVDGCSVFLQQLLECSRRRVSVFMCH